MALITRTTVTDLAIRALQLGFSIIALILVLLQLTDGNENSTGANAVPMLVAALATIVYLLVIGIVGVFKRLPFKALFTCDVLLLALWVASTVVIAWYYSTRNLSNAKDVASAVFGGFNSGLFLLSSLFLLISGVSGKKHGEAAKEYDSSV